MRRLDFLRYGMAALTGAVAGGSLPPARAGSGGSMIPNVEVVDQNGARLSFYDDLVRDRAVMINFFYTGCGQTCPLVTQNLREVQDRLADRMGRDIFMISGSLRPELETPAVLREYADDWQVLPGWSFVTGRPADLDRLRRELGFADSDPAFANDLDSHTGMVRFGNDRLQRWSSTAGLGRPAWIAKTVTSLADMG